MSTTPAPFETYEAGFRTPALSATTGGVSFSTADLAIPEKYLLGAEKVFVSGDLKTAALDIQYKFGSVSLATTLTSALLVGGASSCCAFQSALPSIAFRFGSKQQHTGTLSLANKDITVETADSIYTSRISTKVLDGFATAGSISTRWANNIFAGLSFEYDPSRSGLKFYQYAVLFQQRKELRNGDVLASYDSVRGHGVAARIPLSQPSVIAVVSATPASNEYIVGADYTSLCGAHVGVRADIMSQALAVNVSKLLRDHVRVTLGLVSSLATPKPKFGVNVNFV